MHPDYPRGLPVRLKLVDYDEWSDGGVLVAWGEYTGKCAVAWEDSGVSFVEDGVPADCVEPDLSQPLARSWAREEVARRMGLDPSEGVIFRRVRAGWSIRTSWRVRFLTDEPPFSGSRREVVGVNVDDEAESLAACLRALLPPPVTP